MSEQNIIETTTKADVIRIDLGDWLYNAGIVGLIKILYEDTDSASSKISIYDTHLEVDLKLLKKLPRKYLEVAANMYGRSERLLKTLVDIQRMLDKSEELTDESKNQLKEKIDSKWFQSGVERYSIVVDFNKESIEELKAEVNKSISDLVKKRNSIEVLEKDSKTFLGNLGAWTPRNQRKSGFLHGNIVRTLISHRKLADYISPVVNKEFAEEENIETFGRGKGKTKLKCLNCNHYYAQKNTYFNTGIVAFAGLNSDNINYTWGFNDKLPICSICHLVYLCAFAGFTRSALGSKFLFVNDDSSINNLWEKNQLLAKILQKDKKENILINYFYELLLQEEQIKSKYSLQNIALIEADLEKEVMPKVLSLHVSRNQARFIKDNHDHLKWLASRYYKIKDDYSNILHEFLKLMLGDKMNFGIVHRLTKYYLQSKEESKNFVVVYYNPSIIQQLVLLISSYFKTVKQKNINMESKYIWHIYHLGNDMQKSLKDRQAENKINGIAYRLLNAVRANDKSTFLNVLLRLYIGYNMEVPKSLVNTLESEEKFQIIGHSYINGLLGERLGEKSDQKSQTIS